MKKFVVSILGFAVLFLISCNSGMAADEQMGEFGTNVTDATPAGAAMDLDKASGTVMGSLGGTQYVTLSKPGKAVFVKGRSGEWMPAEDGMVILPGDEVRTEQGSSVMVILDGGNTGQLELKEGSLFKIIKADTDPVTGDKKTLLDLAVGKILVKAEALTGNSKFEVQTPSATTGVRGTLFEIEVEGKLPPRSAV